MLRLVATAAVVAAVVGGGVACSQQSDSSAPAGPAARTSFPGLEPASGEPMLAGVRDGAPAAGRVGRLDGPFDDRFTWGRLALRDDAVTGSLRITSDVSDVLELQVLVAFYDASGDLLGVRRWTHHATEEHAHTGPPSETERFRVVVPARMRDEARSAAVGVPVLVNE